MDSLIFRMMQTVINSAYCPVINKLVKLIILLTILLNCASADIDILYRKEVCDEKAFYMPYVKLLRSRQPNHENFPIVKLLSPGYISLTKHTGVLCINGPAIVYTDMMKDPKCGTDQWILSYGEPQLYSHDCFSINRLAREAYKKSEQQELSKVSKVFGNKVFGVYLIGMSPDYRLPSFAFYPGPNFGFSPGNSWCVHNGASVAFVANDSESSAHCYSVKKYNVEGTVFTSYQGNPLFCYREDRDEDIDMPWRKGETPLTNKDILWDDEGTVCATSSSIQGEVELEPNQLPDFRMIPPKFWSSQGSKGIIYKAKKKVGGGLDDMSVYSKPNPPGSLFPGETGWKDTSYMGSTALKETESESATLEPIQKFQVEIATSDCEEVPIPPELCNQDFGEPCVFISHVLTLEETDWKSDSMRDGSWRLPILNHINVIYEKICPQVARYLPSALSRVFEVFLNKSIERNVTLKDKFNKPQKTEWAEMIADLERCNEKAEMMTFYKKKNEAALKFRNKLETNLSRLYERVYSRREAALKAVAEGTSRSDPIESLLQSASVFNNKGENDTAELQEIETIKNHLNEIPLKFPYKIFVGTPGASAFSNAVQVFQYREAAEVDHELDWALDSYWKVISSVLGYCNLHYSNKDSATFIRLYDSFTQDFLEYISNDWVKGDNRPIYEQVFGGFIHGPGTLWIDACQNGAYQWSGTSDLRPLRPLSIVDGDVPPGSAQTDNGKSQSAPKNFFLDNPGNSKSTTNEFGYEEDGGTDKGGGDVPEPFLGGKSGGSSGRKTAMMDSILDPMHHFI